MIVPIYLMNTKGLLPVPAIFDSRFVPPDPASARVDHAVSQRTAFTRKELGGLGGGDKISLPGLGPPPMLSQTGPSPGGPSARRC